jgi:hypothetical protein
MFTWEEMVPYFLTFLFRESDLYVVEAGPGELAEAGYLTTCGQAKSIMHSYGYDMNFALEIYSALHSHAETEAEEACDGQAESPESPSRRLITSIST